MITDFKKIIRLISCLAQRWAIIGQPTIQPNANVGSALSCCLGNAFFQSSGTVPVSKESWKIAVAIGAISFASSLRTSGLMESWSAALEGFKLVKSFKTPLAVYI